MKIMCVYACFLDDIFVGKCLLVPRNGRRDLRYCTKGSDGNDSSLKSGWPCGKVIVRHDDNDLNRHFTNSKEEGENCQASTSSKGGSVAIKSSVYHCS